MLVRRYAATFLTSLVFAFALSALVFAQDISNTSPVCADVLIVFNRGSGENPDNLFGNLPFTEDFKKNEAVAGSFFLAFKAKMDSEYPKVTYKAVSVHNFPGLYDSNGYKAVGAFSARTFLNVVQAEFAWFPFGEYNKSVGDGKAETAGYIKDQIALCPEQRLVLGGYSQGAQVMGESVFMLSSAERQHVSAMALFGDPKYVGSDIGSTASSLNWFDSATSFFSRPKAKPWKRGSAGLNDRGLADARIPYLPSDLENKTLSWCFNDDFVCSGGSGIFQTIISGIQNGSLPSVSDYANGHSRYATFGAPQAASEIIQRLAPSIRPLDVSLGGVDQEGSPSQVSPTSPNSRAIDIMMMLNTSTGVDDVLGNMRINSIEVMRPLTFFYNNVLYGIGEYSETGTLPNGRIPRTTINQDLTNNLDNLNSKMYKSLAFGGLSGGGLDKPDPHQIGIERAVMSTAWRDEAEKHVVVISNRMPSDNYTYNICNSSVRIGFGITTSNQCNINPALETDLARLHPERCSKVYDVLTKTNCAIGLTNPFHTFNVVRKVDDAIALAQARGIIVDVVVPSTITQFFDSTTGITYTEPMITAALKEIADSTGGVFLQYSSFTKANYTDMYWRILNHKSHVLPLAAIENFDTAGSVDGLSPFTSKTLKAQQPILFDATSENVFEEYKWDFNGDGAWDETTESPSTDYVYSSAVGEVMATVAGFNDGTEQSRSILPLSVTSGEEGQLLVVPVLPEGLKAIRSDGDVVISWTAVTGDTVLFIGDPTSSLPLVSAPLSVGSITLTGFDESTTNLLVWVDDGLSSSAREELLVDSLVVVVEEAPEESVKVLEVSESSPNSQFLGEPVVQNPESVAQSSSSGSTTSTPQTNQPELQSTGGLTEVKAGETQGGTLQQASGFSEDDLADDIDQPVTENSNILPYVISGLVLALLLGGGAYKYFKSKD